MTMRAFPIGGACVAAMIASVNAWLVMFVLFGLIAWTPAGAIVALPVVHLTAENRAAGLGVFSSYCYLGIGVFAALAGRIRDSTGPPGTPYRNWLVSVESEAAQRYRVTSMR